MNSDWNSKHSKSIFHQSTMDYPHCEKCLLQFLIIINIEWINTNINTDNNISNEGITKLSELLMTKHTLSSLDLSGDIFTFTIIIIIIIKHQMNTTWQQTIILETKEYKL